MQKSIGIVGVTGFVGGYLARALVERGYRVVGFSRAGRGDVDAVQEWRKSGDWDFSGLYGVVNLAGERIDQRWTEANRKKFADSRIGLTGEIGAAIRAMPEPQRVKVWVNASAVGFYGDGGDAELDENSARGEGYLADLCVGWEQALKEAGVNGVRTLIVRVGVVLGRGGMAWDRLRLIFSLGLGGRLASGKQWMSWIHIADLVEGMIFCLENERVSGVVNGVSPEPLRNEEFTKQLAAALKRPAIFAVPGWALRLLLGEFGTFLTGGQRVYPRALQSGGYEFRHATLQSALKELL
jgi:uncharacterized protein (TIGR01777 family)